MDVLFLSLKLTLQSESFLVSRVLRKILNFVNFVKFYVWDALNCRTVECCTVEEESFFEEALSMGGIFVSKKKLKRMRYCGLTLLFDLNQARVVGSSIKCVNVF